MPTKKDKDSSSGACASCLVRSSESIRLFLCSQCGLVLYCSKDCQRAHWKTNHRYFCIAKANRVLPAQPAKSIVGQSSGKGEICTICLEPLLNAPEEVLLCGHFFHSTCVAGLREFGLKQVCPLCRADLTLVMMGKKATEEDFYRCAVKYATVASKLIQNKLPWSALPERERLEMDGVISTLRILAEQGHLLSICQMGCLYRQGRGVELNYDTSVSWYTKAAQRGLAAAQSKLGLMYYRGLGVPRDHTEAARWTQRAAGQGYAEAEYNYSLLCVNGHGVKKNEKEALKWRHKAGRNGFAQALYDIGLDFDRGRNCERCDHQSAAMYARAANLGHLEARRALGLAFLLGKGVSKDFDVAVSLIRSAAELGDGPSQLMVLSSLRVKK